MKIGVLGTGKTGSLLFELNSNDVEFVGFNSTSPLTMETGAGLGCVIAFLPSEVFLKYVDILIELRVPVVSGSTGDLDLNRIDSKLKENKLSWIWGSNFSLGMSVVRDIIEKLSTLEKLYTEIDFNIHEVHHTKKLDAPSGTAKTWNEWLGNKAKITSDRTGDVIGEHELNITTNFEKIQLRHESTNRKLFVKGALWGAQYLIKNKLESGLHQFDEIVKKYLKESK